MKSRGLEPEKQPGEAVGYLRVSTDGQEDGNGLDVQRQHIVAYAAVQGLQVSRWYQDVESGAKENREGLSALREDVKTGGVSKVLVYRLDRLSRETLLSEVLFRELSAGSQVISVSEAFGDGFTGDLMRRILAAFADYERAVIATRTKTGRRESVRKNGTFAGGSGVFGYRPVGRRGEPGKGALSIVETEADAVRRAFRLRSEGLTLKAIADELNTAGFRTTTGSLFTHVQVLRVLRRESFYSGDTVLTTSVKVEHASHEAILAG